MTVSSLGPSSPTNPQESTRHRQILARLVKPFILLNATLCLFACIEGREEIWLQSDGSSRTEITFVTNASARRSIQKGMQPLVDAATELPGIHITGPNYRSLNFTTIEVTTTLTIDSPQAALRLQDRLLSPTGDATPLDPTTKALIGEIQTQRNGLDFTIQRAILTDTLLPLKNSTPAAKKRNQALLNDAKLDYIIHLPVPPSQSNAHQVSNQGKTLSWTFPLIDHLDSPPILSLTLRPPTWLIVAIIAITLTLTALTVLFIRFLWKKRRRSPPHTP